MHCCRGSINITFIEPAGHCGTDFESGRNVPRSALIIMCPSFFEICIYDECALPVRDVVLHDVHIYPSGLYCTCYVYSIYYCTVDLSREDLLKISVHDGSVTPPPF